MSDVDGRKLQIRRLVTTSSQGDSPDLRRRGSVVWLSLATYFTGLSGVISGPLLARALGPTNRGLLAAALVYFSILTATAHLGVPLAIGHAVGSGRVSRDGALGAALRFAAVLAIPCALVTVLLLAGPLNPLSHLDRVASAALLFCVPISVLGLSISYCHVSIGWLRPLTVIQVIPSFITTLAAAALYAAGTLTIATYVAATILALFLTLFAAYALLDAAPRRGTPLAPLVRLGLTGYPGTLAALLTVRADQAVLGAVRGPQELGYYVISATIAGLPTALAISISYRAFGNVAASAGEDRAAIVASFVRLTVLVSVAFVAIIAICAPIALPLLYGRAFLKSLAPLYLLLPGAVALAVSGSLATAASASGQLHRVSRAELRGLLVSILGLLFLVPRYGMLGAALVSTIAYTVTMSAYIGARRLADFRILLPGRQDLAYLWRSVQHLRRAVRGRRTT